MESDEKALINSFHRLWYSKGQFQMALGEGSDRVVVQMDARYQGIQVQKNPLDLWIYQEILYETKPDLIVEFGTASGGTTLFLAQQGILNGHPTSVISIDIVDRTEQLPSRDNICYLVGDSVGEEITEALLAEDMSPLFVDKSVMVILDDDHSTEHVRRELDLYNRLVTKGQYLIVEDTNIDDPLGFGNGPQKAVREFLKEHPEFEVDKSREKFLMTWNPNGYLRKK